MAEEAVDRLLHDIVLLRLGPGDHSGCIEALQDVVLECDDPVRYAIYRLLRGVQHRMVSADDADLLQLPQALAELAPVQLEFGSDLGLLGHAVADACDHGRVVLCRFQFGEDAHGFVPEDSRAAEEAFLDAFPECGTVHGQVILRNPSDEHVDLEGLQIIHVRMELPACAERQPLHSHLMVEPLIQRSAGVVDLP